VVSRSAQLRFRTLLLILDYVVNDVSGNGFPEDSLYQGENSPLNPRADYNAVPTKVVFFSNTNTATATPYTGSEF
jgi:hypothetical protein